MPKKSTRYLVYVLECADKTLYVGITNDIEKRLEAHNSKKSGAHYTKIRRPVVLLYKETLPSRSAALKREIAIKKLTRQKKLELIKNG